MIQTKKMVVLVLLVLMVSLVSCARSSSPDLSLNRQGNTLWGEFDTLSIFQSHVLKNYLLLSTDRGLAGLKLDLDEQSAKWILNSQDLILNHTVVSDIEEDAAQYFYLERHRLRFFKLTVPHSGKFPTARSLGVVSTRRYGTLFDGVTPSRYLYAGDRSTLYLARYGRVLGFKPDRVAPDYFSIPNFISYMIADHDYLYYRTFERERPSDHIFAAIDMENRKELWRKHFGPDYQEDWYDIVDSFPVLASDGRIFFIIRAYPSEDYHEKGLFLVKEIIDRKTGEEKTWAELFTNKAVGEDIPVGPIHIHQHHLAGEIHQPGLLEVFDLEKGAILWSIDLGAPLLDLKLDPTDRFYIVLSGDARVLFLDSMTGEIIREILAPDYSAKTFSYGQVHLTQQGDIAGQINNKEAFTSPRAIFFYHQLRP